MSALTAGYARLTQPINTIGVSLDHLIAMRTRNH